MDDVWPYPWFPAIFISGDDIKVRVPVRGTVPPTYPGRFIIVTRKAIEDRLQLTPEAASAMTADERRQFVIANQRLVYRCAIAKMMNMGVRIWAPNRRIDSPRGCGLPDVLELGPGELNE